MGKRKRLTPIEILLILAIIAVLVVWLFPRFLKILDSNTTEIGTVKSYTGVTSGIGYRYPFFGEKNSQCEISFIEIKVKKTNLENG